jgi:hypothetical protein
MAGVACPMMRERPAHGLRFILGLTGGVVGAGLVVSLALYLTGTATGAVIPHDVRVWLLATACGLFGIADLLNRTPHPSRQVPQALVRSLPPGVLGATWGFDLGLLVTTQKVVSLIWAAVAAVALLRPSAAPLLLVMMAVGFCSVIASRTLFRTGGQFAHGSRFDLVRERSAKTGSGLLLLALCVLQIAQTI